MLSATWLRMRACSTVTVSWSPVCMACKYQMANGAEPDQTRQNVCSCLGTNNFCFSFAVRSDKNGNVHSVVHSLYFSRPWVLKAWLVWTVS